MANATRSEQAQVINNLKLKYMKNNQKQAMHLDACKSFGAAEANENERRWNDKMIESKNKDSINNYDKTRMKLNFEIGPDGKIHPLGYQKKPLDVRLQERLNELGWRPFKADSKIQPNCCARFIFGGNRERTLDMAFGIQDVKLEKGFDNSHLHRCEEIEQWALDVHDWCCRRYGKENVIGFQVHLDETSPHIHALIVPVGTRAKSGRECVIWSAKFGKNKYEYGSILREMHTSLYEEVGSKYGLERGDSVEGRNVQHLNKRDYIRELSKEQKRVERAVKGLQSMKSNLEAELSSLTSELNTLERLLADGRITLAKYQDDKAILDEMISDCQEKLDDKKSKLLIKQQELDSLLKDISNVHSTEQPFRNYKIEFNPPQITEKPPMFGSDKWLEKQNKMLSDRFTTMGRKLEELYRKQAERHVETIRKNMLVDLKEVRDLRHENEVKDDFINQWAGIACRIADCFASPDMREEVIAIATALMGGDYVLPSSGGGGNESDLRWDGRRPEEEDYIFKRRCIWHAVNLTMEKSKSKQTKGRSR